MKNDHYDVKLFLGGTIACQAMNIVGSGMPDFIYPFYAGRPMRYGMLDPGLLSIVLTPLDRLLKSIKAWIQDGIYLI